MGDDGESGSVRIVRRAGHPGTKPVVSKATLRDARKRQKRARRRGR